jgi:hypothetical protein
MASTLSLCRIAFVLGSLAAAASAIAQAQPYTYRFDFGPDPQANVQAGFTPINMPAGLIAKAYVIPGGQLTLSTSSANPGMAENMLRLNGVDRGVPPAPANGGLFSYSNLMRDFVSATNTANSQPVLTLVVNGFSANTRYEGTFWSYDAGAAAQSDQRTQWLINGKAFADRVYNTSLPPRDDSDVRTTFSTTFDIGPNDADRRVVFTGKYVSGSQVSVVLNGAQFIPIAAIPEPGASSLLAGGIAVLAWVMRRRSR